ncbi:unnamed protein product [Sphenostylis stenocarpa]|uniref:Uncharacterized protein n=1 Tax=Sphenostylis stenocarpa TaxID=92480 RepID=A0AA86VPF7_9FABA|nr:unnamed protein product [Sphenostylis stenocarpa]
MKTEPPIAVRFHAGAAARSAAAPPHRTCQSRLEKYGNKRHSTYQLCMVPVPLSTLKSWEFKRPTSILVCIRVFIFICSSCLMRLVACTRTLKINQQKRMNTTCVYMKSRVRTKEATGENFTSN